GDALLILEMRVRMHGIPSQFGCPDNAARPIKFRPQRTEKQAESEPEGSEGAHGHRVRLPVVQEAHADEMRHRQTHDRGRKCLAKLVRLGWACEFNDQLLKLCA